MQLEESIAKELAGIVNAQVARCLDEMRKMIAEIPRPEKGEKGERGERGENGERGDKGEIGIAGRDGPAGKDGVDGLGFDDMTLTLSDDGCSVIERYARGNVVKELKRRVRGHYCGPWKEDGEYFFEDTVSSGGSGWVAVVATPKGRPGDCRDWQLFVKKGRDGKDGERGPPGPQGPPGKNASF